MQIIGKDETREALGFGSLIGALQDMFVRGCSVPLRHHHAVNEGLSTLLMPAWQVDGYFGVKIVNIAPGNARLGMAGLFSTYQLFNAVTGEPLALIDGNEITSRRTAAASALAASRLCGPDANTMLIVGAGRVGSLLPEAHSSVRSIREILVWSRTHASAESLAAKLSAQGFDARAVSDLDVAARRADIICCATFSTSPLILGEWLLPGSHLDLIGSFTPTMREADDTCLSDAEVWIDTEEALQKSGDLLEPIENGALRAEDIRGTLADLCRTRHFPIHANRRTVFKAVGTAAEDLAAAILVYEAVVSGDTRF